LVRDGRLYCTNFGETPKEIPVPQHLVQPGIHVEVAPNSVIANNTSLYVYVSREAGSAVDALFNPQVLAEFERDFSYSGFGSLTLRANPGQNIARAEDDVRNTIYTIGTLRAADADGWLITERYDSQRSAFGAVASVSARAWWVETLAWLPTMLAVFGAAMAMVFFVLRSWLARGNLDRLRYMAAIQRNEFVMHYQPIIDAKTLKIVGMEALLRWQHPRRGLLRAAQFVDIFNHDAVASPLAHRVVQLVEKDLNTIPEDLPVWCTINIAPALLEDNAMLTELTKRVSSIGSRRIRLEITERAPLGEYAEVLLHEIRSNGFKVGMDDLGTGYANLSQLQRMPFDFIKIDGMLVRGIQRVDGVSPVVQSLINLARELNAEVVVEGVETKTQADALIKAGATHLQGYFFDAARPIADIVESLRKK
ncbi:MAG: EAL domain-containing protein, partial [Casimicrobium sp.]